LVEISSDLLNFPFQIVDLNYELTLRAYFARGIVGYLRGCIDQGYVKGEDEIEEAFRKLLARITCENSFLDFVVREKLKGTKAYLFDTGSIVLSHSILLNASSCVIISFMLRVSAVARIVASRPLFPDANTLPGDLWPAWINEPLSFNLLQKLLNLQLESPRKI